MSQKISLDPIVSVITPVFNQECYVESSVMSVLEQDYPYIEYIVIDDGSTDNSLSLLKQIARRYPDRLTVLSQPNRGQASTLNRGWHLASGKYLSYLSSDDLLDKSALMRLVECSIPMKK